MRTITSTSSPLRSSVDGWKTINCDIFREICDGLFYKNQSGSVKPEAMIQKPNMIYPSIWWIDGDGSTSFSSCKSTGIRRWGSVRAVTRPLINVNNKIIIMLPSRIVSFLSHGIVKGFSRYLNWLLVCRVYERTDDSFEEMAWVISLRASDYLIPKPSQ